MKDLHTILLNMFFSLLYFSFSLPEQDECGIDVSDNKTEERFDLNINRIRKSLFQDLNKITMFKGYIESFKNEINAHQNPKEELNNKIEEMREKIPKLLNQYWWFLPYEITDNINPETIEGTILDIKDYILGTDKLAYTVEKNSNNELNNAKKGKKNISYKSQSEINLKKNTQNLNTTCLDNSAKTNEKLENENIPYSDSIYCSCDTEVISDEYLSCKDTILSNEDDEFVDSPNKTQNRKAHHASNAEDKAKQRLIDLLEELDNIYESESTSNSDEYCDNTEIYRKYISDVLRPIVKSGFIKAKIKRINKEMSKSPCTEEFITNIEWL